MTTFETLAEHEQTYDHHEHEGPGFFLIAKKLAKDRGKTTPFYAITKGYYDAQGNKRYRTNQTLPEDPDLVEWMVEALKNANKVDGGMSTEFGRNNFLEVKLVENEEIDNKVDCAYYLQATRGYLDAQGARRYKTSIHIPMTDNDLNEWAGNALDEVHQATE